MGFWNYREIERRNKKRGKIIYDLHATLREQDETIRADRIIIAHLTETIDDLRNGTSGGKR